MAMTVLAMWIWVPLSKVQPQNLGSDTVKSCEKKLGDDFVTTDPHPNYGLRYLTQPWPCFVPRCLSGGLCSHCWIKSWLSLTDSTSWLDPGLPHCCGLLWWSGSWLTPVIIAKSALLCFLIYSGLPPSWWRELSLLTSAGSLLSSLVESTPAASCRKQD